MLKFFNLVNRYILMFENDLSPFFQRRLSTWQLWVVAREKKKELIYWASCYHLAWTLGFMEERETEDMTEKRTMGHKQSVKKKKKIYPELTVYNSLCKSLKETYIRWPQRKNTLSLFLLIFLSFFFFFFFLNLTLVYSWTRNYFSGLQVNRFDWNNRNYIQQ